MVKNVATHNDFDDFSHDHPRTTREITYKKQSSRISNFLNCELFHCWKTTHRRIGAEHHYQHVTATQTPNGPKTHTLEHKTKNELSQII